MTACFSMKALQILSSLSARSADMSPPQHSKNSVSFVSASPCIAERDRAGATSAIANRVMNDDLNA